MRLKIKILASRENKWLGWFGDDLMKLRLIVPEGEAVDEILIQFLKIDLGIQTKDINILKVDKNLVEIELPDIAWELFLSAIN